MTAHIVSVVVLKERLINKKRSKDTPLFEESIYLIDIDFDNKEKQEIVRDIKEKLKAEEIIYQNEKGEEISWKMYKVIDLFGDIYHLKIRDLPKEVYSRHLELPSGSAYEEVIQRFYSDYVWEDE